MQRLLTTPEMIAGTWDVAKGEDAGIGEREVSGLLADIGGLWVELFRAEQTRIVKLLVERAEVMVDRLEVHLRAKGLASLVAELRQVPTAAKAA